MTFLSQLQNMIDIKSTSSHDFFDPLKKSLEMANK